MKRRIALYIGSTPAKADLGEDSFVLMNWSNGDLTEPAQIKNSWSRQITLPGTPANDTIFGFIERPDRQTVYGDTGGTGIYFDPSVRTPIQIFDEGGELVDRGYLKLDEVTQNGATHEYKCTIYGGLGGFLYNLAYRSDGMRRTLADLVYKDHNGNVQDLSFNISAMTVKDAWDFLAANSGPHYLQNNKWDFINFAPAYNGYPTGAFSADKAIVDVTQVGIPAPVDGYAPYNGGDDVLISFTGKKTEWETRDLRSYLQRPVLRLGAVLEACADRDNNGGYDVELYDTTFNPALGDNPYVWKTWITLPLLTTLQVHQDGTSSTFSVSSGSNPIPTAMGAEATYRIEVVPKIGAGSGNRYLYADDHAIWINWIELTAQYYDTSNTLVRTQTFRFGPDFYDSSRGQITNAGYFDATGAWVGPPAVLEWTNPAGIGNEMYGRVVLTFTDGGAAFENSPTPRPGVVWTDPSDDSTDVSYTNSPVCSGEYNTAPVDALRSYVDVDAMDLMRGSKTPADYFLSFVKMMGLRIDYDPALNKVSVLPRGTYYGGGMTEISQRINRTKPIVTVPLFLDKRWYEFAMDYSNGAWAKYYKNTRGITYGAQRVDTGFEFDAGTHEVMDGVIFKGAVQILESSKFYCRGEYNGSYVPGVFFDSGSTYQMFNISGDAKSFDLPYPPLLYDYANRSGYPYFDAIDKPQFHNEENAPYDERDTLIFFDAMDGSIAGQGYRLTDDTKAMMVLNKNTPCWDLTGGYAILSTIPHFSRYRDKIDGQYYTSLDFGVPAEIPVPNIQMKDWASIYARNWKGFIEDRLNTDTRVVRCFVNLDGLQAGHDLLRRFFYFDGAVWSLNKIINYSLTTWDDTECEFVKVQDVNNYQ